MGGERCIVFEQRVARWAIARRGDTDQEQGADKTDKALHLSPPQ